MNARPGSLALPLGLLLACSVSVSSSSSPPPQDPKSPSKATDSPSAADDGGDVVADNGAGEDEGGAAPDDPADDGGASDDGGDDGGNPVADADPTSAEDQGMTSHPPSPDEVWVRSPADLEALGLRAQGARGEALLTAVMETIEGGLEDGDYGLLFTSKPTRSAPVVDGERRGLVLLRRIDREGPTCTTVASVDAGSGGGRIRAATKGICGGIACMHSALELGLVKRDEVIAGKNFEEKPLKKLQGRNRKSMSFERLQRVHEALGASKCQIRGGKRGYDTGNAGGLGRFNTELGKFVNDKKHDWDCTILVRTKHRGKWVLAHYEKVRSVKRNADGSTTITTTNGLDQGNQTDRVPAAPGKNTWTSNPGEDPPFSLTGSTHADAAKYMKLPPVGNAKFLCCRKP